MVPHVEQEREVKVRS